MRTEAEVQRAHDLIVGLILDEAPMKTTEEEKLRLSQCASVLCWVLRHDHNVAFSELLASIEKQANDCGATFDRA